MMWRSKRPWFIGVAVLMLAVLGYGVFAYVSSDKAFAATQGTPKEDNQRKISEAQNLQHKWQGLGNTFAKDKDVVDSFLKLAEDRTIWPALNLDLLDGLPQNRKRGQDVATAQRAIVITAISSDYSSHLQGTSGASPASPAPMGGGPDEFGNYVPTATPAPAPTTPAAGAAGGPSPGQPDRGFNIVITGYVEPSANPNDVPGFTMVRNYQDRLLDIAPAPDKKPSDKAYYFVPVGYTGEPITAPQAGPSGTAGGTVIWGQAHGPFWDVFVSDVSGVKPEEHVGQGGAIETTPVGNVGAVDLYAPLSPTGPKMLYGGFNFTLKIKVYMKDASKLTPPAK
jgi:hypothetical protein